MTNTVPNNLPVQLSSFIGRQGELAEVRRLLASSRLVTLTGAGGCGKTRLAIQVATKLCQGDLTGDEEVDPLHREGTEPPVRFAPTAVIAPARSEAMNAAAFPTSSSDVSLFSRVFARIHATSSSRVMGCPVP